MFERRLLEIQFKLLENHFLTFATRATMSSRNWCFTLNNPNGQLTFEESCVSYAVWQGEIGESGTYHYQGYIELKTSRKMSYMKGLIPRAHFEIRRGTDIEARTYAMKEETRAEGDNGPWEFGTFVAKKPGKRNDLDAVKEAIDGGASMMDIAENHFTPFVKYHKGFQLYMNMKEVDMETIKPKVWVIIGPTGTGKTLMSTEGVTQPYFKGSGNWWDGYNPQTHKRIIFDDFYGWVPFHDLLRYLDRYPVPLQIKGGTVWKRYEEVYITSNARPDQWYKDPRLQFSALERRVDRWIFLGHDRSKSANNWIDFTRILAGEDYVLMDETIQ